MTVATFPVSRLHRGSDQLDTVVEFYGKDTAGLPATSRWSPRDVSNPSSYEGGPWDGRVLSHDRYDLSLADRSGQFSGAAFGFAIADLDRLVAGWLTNPLQAVIPSTQTILKAIFESDRIGSETPAVVLRGIVQGYEGPSQYQVSFKGMDWLSARLALDLPMVTVGPAFPAAPTASRSRKGPLWMGRLSDEPSSIPGPVPAAELVSGTGDANPGGPCGYGSLGNGISRPTSGALTEETGGSIAAGVQPYLMSWKTLGGVDGDPDTASFAYGARGVNVLVGADGAAVRATCTDDGDGAIYNFAIGIWSGSAGHVLYNQILSTTDPATGVLFTDLAADGSATPITAGAAAPRFDAIHNYAVTAILADGSETAIAAFWVSVVLPYRRPSRVVSTTIVGAIGYHVYRQEPGDSNWRQVWGVSVTSTNGAGDLVFDDDQLDTGVTYLPDGAPVPKGVVPAIPVGPRTAIVGGDPWQAFALAAHAGKEIESLYIRDSSGVATRVDDTRYGVDVTAPGKTGFSTYWADMFYTAPDGTRWWLVYLRGPDGDDIAAGTLTLWANGTGRETHDDGTGDGILDGVDQIAHVLDNFALTDAPSLTGISQATPTWPDGATRRDLTSFTSTKTRMAATLASGSTRGFAIFQPPKMVDLLGQLAIALDCTFGFTKGGQFRLLLEPTVVETLTPVASFTEIGELVTDSFTWQDRVEPAFYWNQDAYSYQPAYSADGSVSLAKTATLSNAASQARAGVLANTSPSQFVSIWSSTQAAEIDARRLARASVPLRVAIFSTGINGLVPDLGDCVALTTREYPVPGGAVSRLFHVRRQSIDLDQLTVELECWPATSAVVLVVDDLVLDYSSSAQAVTFTGHLTPAVNEGTVAFQLFDTDGITQIPPTVVSGVVAAGLATAGFTVPAGLGA